MAFKAYRTCCIHFGHSVGALRTRRRTSSKYPMPAHKAIAPLSLNLSGAILILGSAWHEHAATLVCALNHVASGKSPVCFPRNSKPRPSVIEKPGLIALELHADLLWRLYGFNEHVGLCISLTNSLTSYFKIWFVHLYSYEASPHLRTSNTRCS